jgi:hypothetical protein
MLFKEALLGIVGSTVCLSSAFAVGTGAIEPDTPSVSVLMGLGSQEGDATSDETEAPKAAKSSGVAYPMYIRFGVGANFMADSDVKGTSGSVSWKTGVDLNLGFGFMLLKGLAAEFEVGMQYNEVDKVKGSGISVNGDGHLYQLPLMGNVRYEFRFGENLSLGILGGAGIQYSNVGGAGSESETAWTFRYQAGIDLAWSLSSTSSLGIYARYSGTPSVTFDDGSFSSLQNVAVGGMLSIAY